MGLNFRGHFFFFFFFEKSPSYRRINTVTAMDRTRFAGVSIPEEKKKRQIGNCEKKKIGSRRFLQVGRSTANLQNFKDGLSRVEPF